MTRGAIARGLVAVVLGLSVSAAAMAADGAGGDPGAQVSSQELESLVETLKDDDARTRFIARLDALIAARRATATPAEAPSAGARILASVSDRVQAAGEGVAAAAELVHDVPAVWSRAWTALQDPTKRGFWLSLIWQIVLVLGAGLAAELAARVVLASPRRAVEVRASDGWLVRIAFLGARTVLDVLPIAAFAATAYAVLPVMRPEPGLRVVLLTLIYASLLARGISAVARMVLAPRAPGLRLFPMSSETAAYLFIWTKRFTNTVVYGYFALEAALLLGLPERAGWVLLKLLGFLVMMLALVFVFQNRRPVADAIRGNKDRARFALVRQRFADVWHALAAVYVIGVFSVWALEVEGGFVFIVRASVLTMVVLLVGFALSRAAQRVTGRLFAISAEFRTQFPGIERRANRYLPAVQTGLRLAIGLFAVLVVLQVWGIDTLGWLSSDLGRRMFGSLFTIVALVVGAVVLWELVSSAIERYLDRLEARGADRARASRLQTLLPLARGAISATLGVVVVLIALSELGLNIAPLLASAGVVGLAIGFGAQTLVKDVITGLFILIEDAISVGDIGEIGGHAGIIEAITIRTIRLRDLEGRVFTIPFSEVSTVVNFTKDYSFAFMEIGIAYRENVDDVIAVLRALAEEMRGEEPWSARILEPLEVFGLDRFGSSEVIVRVRFKTRPGDQFGVRREFYRRMKARFDEIGIEIPFPHVTLYPGQDKSGRAPPLTLRVASDERGSASGDDPPPAAGVPNEAR